MKKFLSLTFLLAASSILGHATTIFCSVIDGGIVSNAGTTAKVDQGGPLASTPVFSCPALDAGMGNILSGVMLLGTGDYDGGSLWRHEWRFGYGSFRTHVWPIRRNCIAHGHGWELFEQH